MRRLTLLLLLSLAATPALACMWDYDTLAMERTRFPSIHELITGKFVRHSEAFYRWRVADRRARLAKQPGDLQLTDDLAVALDKLGQSDEAAELMRQSLAKDADRYETHANLGTFLIHGGKLEAGLEHLERAVEINPDAHFGRERYQILLVRYVLERKGDGELTLPLRRDNKGFDAFLAAEKDEPLDAEDIQSAVKGVSGMLRFGFHDSPILHEALGDLLTHGWNKDAKRLATRAYLRASQGAAKRERFASAAAAYKQRAAEALRMQTVAAGSTTELTLPALEKALAAEVGQADAFVAEVAASEARWIEEGGDVDAKFAARYYQADGTPKPVELDGPTYGGRMPSSDTGSPQRGLLALLAIAGVFVGLYVVGSKIG